MGGIVATIVLSILLPILQLETWPANEAVMRKIERKTAARRRVHPRRVDGRDRHPRPARHDRRDQRAARIGKGQASKGQGRHLAIEQALELYQA
jgi:hypothetical protein